jgi:type II restriction/modification system DNA methylase subunit YeeA
LTLLLALVGFCIIYSFHQFLRRIWNLLLLFQETIRRAVVRKFNVIKGWNCKGIDELYDKIEDKKEANQIINTLKICDPAVGSGHFLVSALVGNRSYTII